MDVRRALVQGVERGGPYDLEPLRVAARGRHAEGVGVAFADVRDIASDVGERIGVQPGGGLVEQERQVLDHVGELVGVLLGEPGRPAADEVDALRPFEARQLDDVGPVRGPRGVAGGDQHMAGARGDELQQVLRNLRAVEHDEPALPEAGQALLGRGDEAAQFVAVADVERGGEGREVLPGHQRGAGPDPPDKVVVARVAVGVLAGHLRLSDASGTLESHQSHAVGRRRAAQAREEPVQLCQHPVTPGEAPVAPFDVRHRRGLVGEPQPAVEVDAGVLVQDQAADGEQTRLGFLAPDSVQADGVQFAGGLGQAVRGDGNRADPCPVCGQQFAEHRGPGPVSSRVEAEVPVVEQEQDAFLGEQPGECLCGGKAAQGVPADEPGGDAGGLALFLDPLGPGLALAREEDGDAVGTIGHTGASSAHLSICAKTIPLCVRFGAEKDS